MPVAVRNATGGGIAVEAAISGFFAFGIGAGSVAAAILARGRISLAPAPRSRHRDGCFLLALASVHARSSGAAHERRHWPNFFATAQDRRSLWNLWLGASAGLFVVPLFSAIQARAAPDKRARTIAAVNIQNALFMVAGSLLTALLQSRFFGFSEPALLAMLGLGNVAAATYIRRAIVGAEAKSVDLRPFAPCPGIFMILTTLRFRPVARPRCVPMSPNRSASRTIAHRTI